MFLTGTTETWTCKRCPSYLQQTTDKPTRFDFESKEISQLRKVFEESARLYELETKEFGVKTCSDIVVKLKNIDLPDNWLLWTPVNDSLHIIHPFLSQEFMAIESYLTIDDICTVRAFVHNTEIPLPSRK